MSITTGKLISEVRDMSPCPGVSKVGVVREGLKIGNDTYRSVCPVGSLVYYFDSYDSYITSGINVLDGTVECVHPEYTVKGNRYEHDEVTDRNDYGGYGRWCGDKGARDAIKMAQDGWAKGREGVRAIADKLNVASRVYRPQVVYDVYGDGGFDMGRVMAGQPESAFTWEDTDQIGTHGKVIKIAVDCGVSGGISADMFKMRGAAVLALIEALEAAGKSVEIDAVCGNAYGYCHAPHAKLAYTVVPIKSAMYAVNDDQVAFALGHPTFTRRFWLSRFSNYMPSPSVSPDLFDADLFLSGMHLYDVQWQNQASTIAWVESKLADLGIILESEY